MSTKNLIIIEKTSESKPEDLHFIFANKSE